MGAFKAKAAKNGELWIDALRHAVERYIDADENPQ
jgi:hypothetical protein